MNTPPVYAVAVRPIVRSDARDVLVLDGTWQLRVDPDQRGTHEGWASGTEYFELPVAVPGCVNAVPELADDYPSLLQTNAYEGPCWYQHWFELPATWADGRVWVKFGGVSPAANVYLNGQHLGFHKQSQVSVKFDATDAACPGEENVLTVELPWRDLGLRGGLAFGPGIYRSVEMERTGDLRLEDLFVRPCVPDHRVEITATLHNDSVRDLAVSAHARVRPAEVREPAFQHQTSPAAVPAGQCHALSVSVDMPGARTWSPHDPFLYVVELEVRAEGATHDAIAERFGMRRLAVEGDVLTLNGEPLMFRAVADEFTRCPTVSPIVDRDLIRQRIQTLRRLGFNAKRYHTHVPPREELDVCDELGLLVHAEISVVSNFNKTEPYPACRDAWRYKLMEIRNHASLAVYCMGNEGSQIMHPLVDKVRRYYADAKALAPDHLVLAASGMQGEHPVPNDFQTPHFWSRCFKWAYDGLSAVPWIGVAPLASEGPLVIHEYGKMTVWPDPEEDAFFRDAHMPLTGDYGEVGRRALADAGLEHLLPRVVRHSRRLSAVCWKMVTEQARRQPGVSGYHIHCAQRVGANRGMADDLGLRIDPEFLDFVKSNGPTALLVDRDFRGRTLCAGEPLSLAVHLSHFGPDDLADARLHWRLLEQGHTWKDGTVEGLSFARGRNGPLCRLTMAAPAGLGKLTLQVRLDTPAGPVTDNAWDFWRFPHPTHRLADAVLTDADDARWELDVMAHFPTLCRLDDAVTARRGVNVSRFNEPTDYLTEYPPTAVIADRWTDALRDYTAAGGTVLLLDTGHFPAPWYAPADDRDRGYDLFAQFTPFRAGWDHGNAATVIEDHPSMGDFPHEGFCDLQCFAMVQGAKTLRVAHLPGQVDPVVHVIPMWRTMNPGGVPEPDDPAWRRRWRTENRVYVAACGVGRGRLLVSSFRHLAGPAGRHLLEQLVRYAAGPNTR